MICGLFALGIVTTTRADVVILENGDRITGEIVRSGPSILKVETSYAGVVAISRKDISRIKSMGQSLQKVESSQVPPEEGAAKNTDTPSVEEVDDAIEQSEDDEWEGSVNLATEFEGIGGNTDRELDVNMSLLWERDPHRFRMLGQVELNSIGSTTTKQNWLVIPRYDYFFTENVYASVLYGAKQEKYDGLNLRQTVGAGLGYEVFSNDVTELTSELGAYGTTDDYTNRPDEGYVTPGWHLEFRRQLWEDRIELYHRQFLFVRVDESGQSLWQSWSGLKIPIRDGVNVSTELELDYDNITLNRASDLEDTFRLMLGFDW